jgi:hypothetical protein
VVVRDNKAPGQDRVALLDAEYRVTDVSWPGAEPVDLESIDAVPGHPGRYVTCTSAGSCYDVRIDGDSLAVLRTFTLPAGRDQNEAFAMTTADDGSLLALWANRGSATTPGVLFTATFDVATGSFGAVSRADISVPYPTTNVRPVSDATIVGSRVVITSASDNGDDGPFDSEVYEIGTVALVQGDAVLDLHSPVSLGRFPGHKVEGIACLDGHGTGMLGTDDENLGGYVVQADVCPATSPPPPDTGSPPGTGKPAKLTTRLTLKVHDRHPARHHKVRFSGRLEPRSPLTVGQRVVLSFRPRGAEGFEVVRTTNVTSKHRFRFHVIKVGTAGRYRAKLAATDALRAAKAAIRYRHHRFWRT